MAASRARKAGKAETLPITERDIPIGIVGVVTLVCMLPIGWLLGDFGTSSGLGAHLPTLIIGGVVYIVLMSFFVSAVCGYMAGLIGSSNSPLSGIGILVVIGAALLLVVGVKPYVGPDAGKALIAFALFTTAVIFNVAAIANNNLQDLKTGQLVDATPWKQQVALVIGVIAGAFVIPPVLDLVNHAYGFVGAPGAELRPNPLPAPQAGLISSLAKGVISGDIDWSLIRIGGMIGVGIILLDEILRTDDKTHACSAVGGRAWNLSADAKHADDRRRRDRRLVFRPACRSHSETRGNKAARRFARIRHDRWRRNYRRRHLSACGVFRKGFPALGRGPRLRNSWNHHRRRRLRRDRIAALPVDPADGEPAAGSEIGVKRKWNWSLWGRFRVRDRRLSDLFVLHPIPGYARFSVGRTSCCSVLAEFFF